MEDTAAPLYEKLIAMQKPSLGSKFASEVGSAVSGASQGIEKQRIENFRAMGADGLFKAAQQAGIERPERYLYMGQHDYVSAEAKLADEIKQRRVGGYVSEYSKRANEDIQKRMDESKTPMDAAAVAKMRGEATDELRARRGQAGSAEEIAAIDMLAPGGAGGMADYRMARLAQTDEIFDKNQQSKAADFVRKVVNDSKIQPDIASAQQLNIGAKDLQQQIVSVLPVSSPEELAKLGSASDPNMGGALGKVVAKGGELLQQIMQMGGKENTQKLIQTIQKGLKSNDAQQRVRASIMATVVAHLRQTSGAAVTDGEAGRLLDGVFNSTTGLRGMMNGLNTLVRQSNEKARTSLDRVGAHLSNSNMEYVPQEWENVKSAFATEPYMFSDDFIAMFDDKPASSGGGGAAPAAGGAPKSKGIGLIQAARAATARKAGAK